MKGDERGLNEGIEKFVMKADLGAPATCDSAQKTVWTLAEYKL